MFHLPKCSLDMFLKQRTSQDAIALNYLKCTSTTLFYGILTNQTLFFSGPISCKLFSLTLNSKEYKKRRNFLNNNSQTGFPKKTNYFIKFKEKNPLNLKKKKKNNN